MHASSPRFPRWLLLAFAAATLLPLHARAANSTPQVTINAITVDTVLHQVVIRYTLQDAEAEACRITAQLSADGGLTYGFSTTGVNGDVGYPIVPGTNKVIRWDYDPGVVDLSGAGAQDFRVRLVADDLVPVSVADIVAQVDGARMRTNLEQIEGPRHPASFPDHLENVRNFIGAQMAAQGVHVRGQIFSTGGNIIGRHPGITNEARTYVVDAHYDTVAGSPGADDNGSGVVGVLEAIRVLAPYAADSTFEFIAFDREEAGHDGSLAYVADGMVPGTECAGAFNLEMIGYYDSAPNTQAVPEWFQFLLPELYAAIEADQFRGNFINGSGNAVAEGLRAAFVAAGATYVPDLRILIVMVPPELENEPSVRRSDHASFWDAGLPAFTLSDTADSRNPHYHAITDTTDTLNFTFMSNVVKATVATLINLGGVRHATVANGAISLAAGAAPTVVAPADQAVAPGMSTGALAVMIGDADTPPASLTLLAQSSNPTLVPVENIVFGGTGTNRTVTVTPVANQTGTATITLTVSDAALSASDTFVVRAGTGPSAPEQLDRVAVTSTGFTAQWAGVPGATGYRLDVARDAAFTNFVAGLQNLDVGAATSHPVAGLTTGTYYVRIRSYDASGVGASGTPLLVGLGGRVVNLSARGRTDTGAGVLIAGFVVSGGGAKPLLLRASGPALTSLFGLPGVPDPRLALFDNANPPQPIPPGNDDWNAGDNALQQAIAAVNAFDFPANSKDAAMVVNLPQGLYSVHAQPVTGEPGISILELYELDGTAELVNISARAFVGTGNEVLIPGTFIGIAGKRLLVRAVGETLGTVYGVPGVLVDPMIQVHQVGSNTPLFSNDDWSSPANAAQVAAAASAVGAFNLPVGSKDATVLADLPAGGFTFVISGKGQTGIVLFELYVVP